MADVRPEKYKNIIVRIDERLKEDFMLICKLRALNGSQLIRNWIQSYVEENQSILEHKSPIR